MKFIQNGRTDRQTDRQTEPPLRYAHCAKTTRRFTTYTHISPGHYLLLLLSPRNRSNNRPTYTAAQNIPQKPLDVRVVLSRLKLKWLSCLRCWQAVTKNERQVTSNSMMQISSFESLSSGSKLITERTQMWYH